MLLCCSVGKIFIYIGALSLNHPFLSFPSFYFFCFETQLYTEPIPLRLYLNCNLSHEHIDIPLGSGLFLTTGVVVKFCTDAQHILGPPRKSRAIGIFRAPPSRGVQNFWPHPLIYSNAQYFFRCKRMKYFWLPQEGLKYFDPTKEGSKFCWPPKSTIPC